MLSRLDAAVIEALQLACMATCAISDCTARQATESHGRSIGFYTSMPTHLGYLGLQLCPHAQAKLTAINVNCVFDHK